MRRIVRIVLCICVTWHLAAPLTAQDALVTLNPPYGFLLQENAVVLEKIIVLKKAVIEPEEALKYLQYRFDGPIIEPFQWPRSYSHSSTQSRDTFRLLYNKPKVDESMLIRQDWERFFGMDVWYPYYKAKEAEEWVKERFSVKVFKLKGRPEFSKRGVTYIFKTRF